jgi:hypothetical protein
MKSIYKMYYYCDADMKSLLEYLWQDIYPRYSSVDPFLRLEQNNYY